MTCAICHHKTTILYDPQFELEYHSCHNCGFIAQDRNQLILFNEEREEYDRHENSIENEGYVAYFKRFIDAAVIPYAQVGKGLDYGSGPEPVLSQVMLRDYGAEMDIYDLHYQPEKVFEGKVYDYIISTEVIEHVKEPLEVLQLMYQHLKPGGIAAIMTLFHLNDEVKFLDWWYRRDVTHISFFLPKTFRLMAKLIGFEVIYCDDKRYITLKKPV